MVQKFGENNAFLVLLLPAIGKHNFASKWWRKALFFAAAEKMWSRARGNYTRVQCSPLGKKYIS
jgi:hypothetical protein